MSDTIKGDYIGFSQAGQFMYRYVCSICGTRWRESTPEVSAPCVCHRCATTCPARMTADYRKLEGANDE